MLRRLMIPMILPLVCQELLFPWGCLVGRGLTADELPVRPPVGSPASITARGEELVVESIVLTIARQAEIPARDDGVLAQLLVQEGRAVQAGEVVGKLDDEAIRLAYHRAVLELERAQRVAGNDTKVRLATKELEIAQSEYQRASEAEARFSKSVTAAELERLKLEVDRAVLAREQALFEWDTARTLVRIHENEVQSVVERARRRRITSPLAGTVAAIARRPGEWLETGQVVMRVIATDVLRAEGFLSADSLARTPRWVARRP
ncbi:MAG: HlyD family secretion protein [Pirellulaceae bacterium]